MTTTGWIIWFACLGLGSIAVVLIAWRISKGMVRDQEQRERDAHNARVVWLDRLDREREQEPCIDCDRPMRDCTCEDVLRCSCGIPDVVCVCAGKVER